MNIEQFIQKLIMCIISSLANLSPRSFPFEIFITLPEFCQANTIWSQTFQQIFMRSGPDSGEWRIETSGPRRLHLGRPSVRFPRPAVSFDCQDLGEVFFSGFTFSHKRNADFGCFFRCHFADGDPWSRVSFACKDS
jgi:hypothetical protein